MNILHVVAVVAVGAVFILHLHRDDRPTTRRHQRRQLLTQTLQIGVRRREVSRVLRTHPQVRIGKQPRGKTARLPLGADIGARPQDYIQALGLRHPDKGHHIVGSAEIEVAALRFHRVPEHVSFDGVQTHRTRLAQAVAPVLGWNALKVDRAGNDLIRLARANEVIVLDGDWPCAGHHRCCANAAGYRQQQRDDRQAAQQRADVCSPHANSPNDGDASATAAP